MVMKLFMVDGGTAITGLTDGSTYYVVSSTSNTIKLSATSGGTAIDLTAVGAGTQNLDRQNYGNLEQTVSGLDNDALEFDSTDTAVVVIADNEIVKANTFTASEPVTYDADGGTAIGGLTDGKNVLHCERHSIKISIGKLTKRQRNQSDSGRRHDAQVYV